MSNTPVSNQDLVLVTGATGFLAGHLIKRLLELGYTVRGTVRDVANEEKRAHLAALPGAAERLTFVQANLVSDDGWDEAVAGCGGVFHTASPAPIEKPEDEMELIRPAVDGTLRVLRACQRAGGTVKRVVVTSSSSAVVSGFGGGGAREGETFNEENWSDDTPTKDAYTKSKCMAERAAYKFVAELDEAERFELATVHPTFCLGPVINPRGASSYELVTRLMNRVDPGVVDLPLNVVDVRDVTHGHVQAMVLPEAAGHRHCLHSASTSVPEVAGWLADEFNDKGYNVATTVIPYPVVWLLARCDGKLRSLLPDMGRKPHTIDHSRAERVLGVDFTPPQKSVLDMAYSMIEKGTIEDRRKKE